MITVTVYRTDGSYSGFKAEGHAGYAEEGEDIICAASSVLMINTVNASEALTSDEVSAEEGASGYLSCTFPGGLSPQGKLLMDAMLLGLSQVSETREADSGKPYVSVLFEEV